MTHPEQVPDRIVIVADAVPLLPGDGDRLGGGLPSCLDAETRAQRLTQPGLGRPSELAEIFKFVGMILPWVTAIVALTVGGWVFTTWLRIKNGYPLETSWGRPLHPQTDNEAKERIKLLTGENAQLRAELGSVKDRMETIERIITDEPHRLSQEIDSLSLIDGGKK